MTSHDVVARVRRIAGERSVGHLGTLDPSATGVLPLVLGRFTRLAQFYTNADKRYEGMIQFGWSTDTYDAQGELQGPKQPVHLTLGQVRQAAGKFAGGIEKVPQPFLAKRSRASRPINLRAKNRRLNLNPNRSRSKSSRFWI